MVWQTAAIRELRDAIKAATPAPSDVEVPMLSEVNEEAGGSEGRGEAWQKWSVGGRKVPCRFSADQKSLGRLVPRHHVGASVRQAQASEPNTA